MTLSRDRLRNVDRCAIEQLGVNGLVLMENAGRQAADEVEAMAVGGAVGIVAGGGNNGGDGYVVARHLILRGCEVGVLVVVPEEKITGDALENLRIIRRLGIDVRFVDPSELDAPLGEFTLLVDAIGGTGIQGALRGGMAEAVERMNAAGPRIVAIDIPTGLDCDTGAAEGPAVRATKTVTFVARKKGFDAPGAAEYTGHVIVADIGVPADLSERLKPAVE